MHLTSLTLKNFRKFKDVSFKFTGNGPTSDLIVFAGGNGSGKSTILDAIALGLTWLIARIHREKGVGRVIDELDIRNGSSTAQVGLSFRNEVVGAGWTLSKSRRGSVKTDESNLKDLSSFAEIVRTNLTKAWGIGTDSASLPLVAYYPVGRVVLDIPLKIKVKHSFEQLNGYDNALDNSADFRRFFEWFREREDVENEILASAVQRILDAPFDELDQIDLTTKDRQLQAVRNAVAEFMPGFSDLKVKRKPRLQMVVKKGDQLLDVNQLSQGEKTLMALVGDLARRLAMMNPNAENPLLGKGVVLIDEIELHLHPRWQRNIIPALRRTFPNCQFIISTHSPQVLGEADGATVFLLDDEIKEGFREVSTFGKDTNRILSEDMDAKTRNPEVSAKIDSLFVMLRHRQVDHATVLLAELENSLGDLEPEIIKARMILKRMRDTDAAHNKG